MTAELSATQARRIVLTAQGFTDRAPTGAPTAHHLRRVLARTKLIQMDSVNVAVRAHYLPLFSRLGPYDRDLLDRAAWRPRRGNRLLTEYWAHEAALIPVADWPLFGWRMAEYRDGRYQHVRDLMRRNRTLAAEVRAVIADVGASTPRTIERALGIERTPQAAGGWWNRGDVKHLCEAMFASGELAAVRDNAFGRHYDLAERVLGPSTVARHVSREEAHRELVSRASAALGVATAADIADYYRLKTADVRVAIAALCDDRRLEPVSVAGWKEQAYLAAQTTTSRRHGPVRATILSPFDPLVFFRPRAQRVFDFHYRIEIYVPEHKRIHGYYVHPYLLGDQIAARVDLKADRNRGLLVVPGAFIEPEQSPSTVAPALAADLRTLADWLGLEAIEVGARGDLVDALRRVVG